ncbi:MAG: twin-arginine translocase TatA/TatE family subunit [Chloroflexota bacterium]|nr:twin-arginine translocase TatA/TatE family subunit [Chloroflexota bacterium]
MGTEIFGVGLPEMVIIAVVALIFLGPDRLPEVARTMGGWVRQFRDLTSEATGVWQETLGVGDTIRESIGLDGITTSIRDSLRLDGSSTRTPATPAATAMPITYTPADIAPANPAFTPPPLDYPAPFTEPAPPPVRPTAPATSEVLNYPAPPSQ